MIGYVCKYTPIEIIEAFGEKSLRIDPSVSSFDKADTLMHPNMCSYSKAVLEHILKNNIEEIVLTTCCDSIKRLYDVLKSQSQVKFIYIIDIPRKINSLSVKLFKNELVKFIHAYENFSGKKFDINILEESIKAKNNTNISTNSNNTNLWIMGARCSQSIIDTIENSGSKVTNNLTCTGQIRKFTMENHNKDILLNYAQNILNFYPCMRMIEVNKKYSLLQDLDKQCAGIIYHTVKFCDSYSYDYVKLKNITNVPILKIETDYTKQCEGQIKTRIEAFIESLKTQNNKHNNSTFNHIALDNTTSNIVMGIDSGSTSTNVVIIDEHKKILSYSVVRTGAKSKISAEKAVTLALNKLHIKRDQLSLIVSTGYGRVNLSFADMNVTEITCHGKGAHHINDEVRTIIDIGGQDSKVIRLNEKGDVTDFIMNDKCAAGTGKFLEMMARTLEIPIEDMGPKSLKWKKDIPITSMCTVFAESEVISLIAENVDTADIIHGLNNSIARKTTSLLGRVGKMEKYMMSGGVAKNIGVVKTIEEKLETKLFIPEEPEIIGALGAALIGLESIKK